MWCRSIVSNHVRNTCSESASTMTSSGLVTSTSEVMANAARKLGFATARRN